MRRKCLADTSVAASLPLVARLVTATWADAAILSASSVVEEEKLVH